MIFKHVKPSAIQNWISVNAPGSLRTTPRDSWRAYLVAQGATGKSEYDLEASFLTATPGGTLFDKWQGWLTLNGGGSGKSKDKFQTKFK